jgi:hypothetical protein
MNLHYKISPGVDLSDNRAVEIRWFKSFAAYETASVESGGSGGVVSSNDVQETSDRSTI